MSGQLLWGHCLRVSSTDRLTAQLFANLLATVRICLLKDVPIGLRQTLCLSRQGSCTIWERCGSCWIKYNVWIWCGGLSSWSASTHVTNPTDLFLVGTPEVAGIHSTCQVHRRPCTEAPDNCNKSRRQRVRTRSRKRRISQRLQLRNGPRTFVKHAVASVIQVLITCTSWRLLVIRKFNVFEHVFYKIFDLFTFWTATAEKRNYVWSFCFLNT